MLTWSLALATYERRDVLIECIRNVLRQTHQPKEIVIVDGSVQWEDSYRALIKACPELAECNLTYREADIKSAAAQRNQAMDLCSSDVIFFIDDDTYLYPDCAARIMEVYEADLRGEIAAVAGSNVELPPSRQSAADATPPSLLATSPGGGWLKRLVRLILKADERFVPYEEFQQVVEPEFLRGFDVAYCKTLPGFSLTMRADIAKELRFEQRMRRYSSEEDSDLTYRSTRGGRLLLKALNAHLHHVGSEGGRLGAYNTTALSAVNLIYLHRMHSLDLSGSKARLRKNLFRRVFLEAAKDVQYKGFSLPRMRGIIYGLCQLDLLNAGDLSDAVRKYEQIQQKLTK